MTIQNLYRHLCLQYSSIDAFSIRELLASMHNLSHQRDVFFSKDLAFDLDTYTPFINRLLLGEPIAYIIGKTTFANLTFKVNQNVLIPRPESEELVLLIQQKLSTHPALTLLDVGTGSGCLAIAIQKRFPLMSVYASDVSEPALEVAKLNANDHQCRIQFFQSSILDTIPNDIAFDIIVSNPPYIEDETTIDQSVKMYEPTLALIAHPGEYFYENIMRQAFEKFKTVRYFAFEIAPYLQARLNEILKKNQHWNLHIEYVKDINGKVRFAWIQKNDL